MTHNWLHIVYVGVKRVTVRRYHHRVDKIWAVRKFGSQRALRISTDYELIVMYATWFSLRHRLKLFTHNEDGVVQGVMPYDVLPKEGMNVMTPSKEFKTYYNQDLLNKLQLAVPASAKSQTIKELKVRSRFKGTEQPELVNIMVKTYAGEKIRIKAEVKGFPSDELIAKISLLA